MLIENIPKKWIIQMRKKVEMTDEPAREKERSPFTLKVVVAPHELEWLEHVADSMCDDTHFIRPEDVLYAMLVTTMHGQTLVNNPG
jgi:hypothetical protein